MSNSQVDLPPYSIAIHHPPSDGFLELGKLNADSVVIKPHEELVGDGPKTAKDLWDQLITHKWSMFFVLFFISLSSIPLAALIIGGSKRWDCPDNPKMPVWLIVSGVTGIIWYWSTALLILLRAVCNDRCRKRLKWVLLLISILFLIFLIAWTITGLLWSNNGSEKKCDSTISNFSLGLIITQMFFICVSFCCLSG